MTTMMSRVSKQGLREFWWNSVSLNKLKAFSAIHKEKNFSVFNESSSSFCVGAVTVEGSQLQCQMSKVSTGILHFRFRMSLNIYNYRGSCSNLWDRFFRIQEFFDYKFQKTFHAYWPGTLKSKAQENPSSFNYLRISRCLRCNLCEWHGRQNKMEGIRQHFTDPEYEMMRNRREI